MYPLIDYRIWVMQSTIKRGAELRARETVPGLENRETWGTQLDLL
jgi:hypothetical protein